MTDLQPTFRSPYMPLLIEVSLVPAAYLLGSISSAILVCRLFGLQDPRTQGSKNPGATNVLRIGGKAPAIITLLGDGLKGYLPVLLGVLLDVSPVVLAASMLAAFLGHLYPLYFGFAGGKGVATGFGVLLGLSPLAGGLTIAVWLLMALLFRYSSLAALTAALLAPGFVWLASHDAVLVGAVGLMTLMQFWKHRANIENLLAGRESRIGQKNKPRQATDPAMEEE